MTRPIAAVALLFACVLPLAGCVSAAGEDAHTYPGLFGQRVVGNETYVTVSNVYNEMDALPLAERHCSHYGRTARFNHMEQIRAVFDCLPRRQTNRRDDGATA